MIGRKKGRNEGRREVMITKKEGRKERGSY